ncbi:uncharacterized protein C8Q71DRAFT_121929 [Rhodofomes roseus]|uniref:Uncharacterized protein n=1 Tax=Rhodofomes roseus TaxID=34475 RepID=A0ABQ8KB53_9APHY|nr:uncharacterized protein C8Q71DRAFT_121929 [Rhodofomes roseus]KAH9834738.1 hypothetical protein C8Q71DRAFT_121929 [Rhodofomes roseus]
MSSASPPHRLALSPSKYANAAARPRASVLVRMSWRCRPRAWASLLICRSCACARSCGGSGTWWAESRWVVLYTRAPGSPLYTLPRQGCVLSVRAAQYERGAVQECVTLALPASRGLQCCARRTDLVQCNINLKRNVFLDLELERLAHSDS